MQPLMLAPMATALTCCLPLSSQERLDPIDWATYEPYLWANVQKYYHRVVILFGSLIQLQRAHPEAARAQVSGMRQGGQGHTLSGGKVGLGLVVCDLRGIQVGLGAANPKLYRTCNPRGQYRYRTDEVGCGRAGWGGATPSSSMGTGQ